MPARNQTIIRRDVNRLEELIQRTKNENPALLAISPAISSAAEMVNRSWQNYQAASVKGDKEREERDQAIGRLIQWIQSWRPVIMLTIPGADSNINKLPTAGATPDDVIRVAQDMIVFMRNNPGTAAYSASAIDDLGDSLENAKKETSEATAVLPEEAAARHAFTEVCNNANSVLVRGLEVVRAIFGRKSPEYKQFIARSSSDSEDESVNEESVVE